MKCKLCGQELTEEDRIEYYPLGFYYTEGCINIHEECIVNRKKLDQIKKQILKKYGEAI